MGDERQGVILKATQDVEHGSREKLQLHIFWFFGSIDSPHGYSWQTPE